VNIGFTSSGPGMGQIQRGISALEGADALVGIPESDPTRNAGDPISNAELLFIFTNGSPLRGQPPRVVIEAAIETEPTKSLIAKELAAACTASMDGDEEGMISHLDRAGQIGESASKRWFTDPANDWAPNAASTILAKGSDTPGIDTGQMRRAITHVVETGSRNGPNSGDVEGGIEEGVEATAELGVEAGESIVEVAELAAI
jgi:hypothetical protein